MEAFGVYRETSALLRKVKNKIEVVSLQESAPSSQAIIVTGLETKDVVRRELSIPLKSEKEIVAALSFQIESCIPFPPDQAIVVPLLYPQGDVVVFAASCKTVEEHVKQQRKPEIVSAVPAALARYAAFYYPELKRFYLLHEGTALAVIDGKIVVSQAFAPEDQQRAEAHILSKCGQIEKLKDLPAHAVAVGLSLDALAGDGKSMQFLQGPYRSEQEKKKEKSLAYRYGIAASALTVLVLATTWIFSGMKERELHRRLDEMIGESSASLQTRIAAWRQQIFEEKKRFPLSAPIVPLSHFLAWMSDKKEEVDVTRLHYSLVKYPKMGQANDRYLVKVDLEITAPNPTVARAFHDALRKDHQVVDTQKEITWNVTSDRYRASFYLKDCS